MVRAFILLLALVFLLPTSKSLAGTFDDEISQASALEQTDLRLTQNRINELAKAIKAKKSSQSTYEAERLKLGDPWNTASKALKEAEAAQLEAGKKVQAVAGKMKGIYGFRSPDIDPVALDTATTDLKTAGTALIAAQAAFDKTDSEWKAADEKAKAAIAEIEKASATLTAEGTSKTAAAARQKQKEEAMKLQIKDLGLDVAKAGAGQKMGDLKNKFENASLNQKVLEATYNQGLIGNYMQAVLQGLLKDKNFCQAAQSCPKDSGTPGDSNFKPDLKELFSTTSSERAKKGSAESHK